jgi:fermentation-respiration switch protein FrsA (DUF1100 family)
MAMTSTLFKSATNSKGKQLLIVPNGEHNNTYIVAGEEYVTKLR